MASRDADSVGADCPSRTAKPAAGLAGTAPDAARARHRRDLWHAKDPLDQCPSAPHRAVARLLAMSVGARPGDACGSDIEASTAEDLAGISGAHYVGTVLASALETRPEVETLVPRDLAIFLVEMRAANEQRNARLRRQLLEIGRGAAERGLSLVALKGAAELLSPLHRIGHRYISDIDLLADEADIAPARSLLHDLGAQEADVADINLRGHYHLAPFLSDAWAAQVELHRALGPDWLSCVLPPRVVLADARPSGMPGLRLPSPPHRLAHLVLHARKDAGAQQNLRVSLRDVLEFHQMKGAMAPADLEFASAMLSTGNAREAFELLEAMHCAVFAPQLWDIFEPRAKRLGAQALHTYGRPGDQMWNEAVHWIGHYVRAVFRDRARRRHFLQEILRPGGLGEWIVHHCNRWRRIR